MNGDGFIDVHEFDRALQHGLLAYRNPTALSGTVALGGVDQPHKATHRGSAVAIGHYTRHNEPLLFDEPVLVAETPAAEVIQGPVSGENAMRRAYLEGLKQSTDKRIEQTDVAYCIKYAEYNQLLSKYGVQQTNEAPSTHQQSAHTANVTRAPSVPCVHTPTSTQHTTAAASAQQHIDDTFDRLDTNNDGVLDRAEFQAGFPNTSGIVQQPPQNAAPPETTQNISTIGVDQPVAVAQPIVVRANLDPQTQSGDAHARTGMQVGTHRRLSCCVRQREQIAAALAAVQLRRAQEQQS